MIQQGNNNNEGVKGGIGCKFNFKIFFSRYWNLRKNKRNGKHFITKRLNNEGIWRELLAKTNRSEIEKQRT
jgi:hypothetical protein